jgi:hypothetical protein
VQAAGLSGIDVARVVKKLAERAGLDPITPGIRSGPARRRRQPLPVLQSVLSWPKLGTGRSIPFVGASGLGARFARIVRASWACELGREVSGSAILVPATSLAFQSVCRTRAANLQF